MTEYVSQLSAFYATTSIINFIKISESEDPDEDNQMFSPKRYIQKESSYRQLTIKLKLQKYVSKLTVVHELWIALQKEFKLPSLTATIDKILEGGLTITWLVLPHVVKKFKATFSCHSNSFNTTV